MKGLKGCAALAAWTLLAGLPATALDDVSGVYEGKLTCRQIAGGSAAKSKQDVSVTVSEEMSDIALDISASGVPFATAMRGFVADDAAKANRGKLTAVECGLSVSNHNGAAVHADVTIPPGSEKGKLKGTLILMESATTTATLCSLSAKRITTEVGPIELCL